MKLLFKYFLFLSILISCNSFKNSKNYQEFIGEAQGTTFYISYYDSSNRDFSKEMIAILQEFDKQVSTYKIGSVINQFNSNEIDSFSVTKNPYLEECFKQSIKLNNQTMGYFNHGLNNLIQATKNSRSSSFLNKNDRDSILLIPNQIRGRNGFIKKIDSRCQFNFNAIAQGYSVDVLADFLESKGVENYMVEIGGELRVKGKNSDRELWTVSLEAPNSTRNNRAVQATIAVDNKAVVTSGSYRKFKEIDGKKYSHAINPKTGLGVTHNLLSVSVVCEKASVADALATAFLVMGKEKTIQLLDSNNLYNVSLLFIEADSLDNFTSSYYGDFENLILE